MLTAVVLFCGETTLQRTLDALRFCDHIILMVDTERGQQPALFSSLNVQIVTRELNRDFALQRNAADSHISSGWILHIDADEVVSPELAEEIRRMITVDDNIVYSLRRHDVWWGKQLRHGELDTAARSGLIRLYRKGAGEWRGAVHESFVTDREVRILHYPILHYAHKSISDFLQSINRYSSIRADEMLKQKVPFRLLSLLLLPPAKFIYTFVVKAGWKDGSEGFAYSFLMSFHSFLVRAKMYKRQSIGY